MVTMGEICITEQLVYVYDNMQLVEQVDSLDKFTCHESSNKKQSRKIEGGFERSL